MPGVIRMAPIISDSNLVIRCQNPATVVISYGNSPNMNRYEYNRQLE